jgi:hypothetical protein
VPHTCVVCMCATIRIMRPSNRDLFFHRSNQGICGRINFEDFHDSGHPSENSLVIDVLAILIRPSLFSSPRPEWYCLLTQLRNVRPQELNSCIAALFVIFFS